MHGLTAPAQPRELESKYSPWSVLDDREYRNGRPMGARRISIADLRNMVEATVWREVLLALLTQLDRRRDPHRIRRCDSLATGRIQK